MPAGAPVPTPPTPPAEPPRLDPESAWEQLAADLHGDRAALVGFATS